jgi:REP element-mobilizing transposase RayT
MQPRQVLPGQFYMITRRCTQRQFLLRPDPATNNAFTYCLIDAAQRSQVEVLLTSAMSNHHHTVIYDPRGRYPEFVEHFHKMLARSQNALRGRWENLWSSEQVCVVKLVGREAVIDKLVYTATNPVQDHLVDRVHHWPGVNARARSWPDAACARRGRGTSSGPTSGPTGRCPRRSRCGSRSRRSLGSRPRCSRSCGTASVRSRSSARPNDSAPAAACWDGARCWRNRGVVNRRAVSRGAPLRPRVATRKQVGADRGADARPRVRGRPRVRSRAVVDVLS